MRPPQRALAAALCSVTAAATCVLYLSAVRARRARAAELLGFLKERRAYGSGTRVRLKQFPILMRCKREDPREFRLLTRCTPETFDALVARVADTKPYAMRKKRRKRGGQYAYPLEYEVALGLYVLSGRETYHRVGSRWGCVPSVVHAIMRRFVAAVCELEPEVIRWPDDAETTEIQEGFRQLKPGLPLCVGAIDCVHVEILRPSKDPGDYICRKKRYSINTQAIVDHRGLFLHVYAGWPGRAHDARVFHHSRVSELLKARCTTSDGNVKAYIIGDSAYARRAYMLVGYADPKTDDESIANAYISNARVVVENAFGRLKNRFRSLKFLEVKTKSVPHWILATMVLHNFIERCEGPSDFNDKRVGEQDDPVELRRDDRIDSRLDDSAAGKALLAKVTAYIKSLRAARGAA